MEYDISPQEAAHNERMKAKAVKDKQEANDDEKRSAERVEKAKEKKKENPTSMADSADRAADNIKAKEAEHNKKMAEYKKLVVSGQIDYLVIQLFHKGMVKTAGLYFTPPIKKAEIKKEFFKFAESAGDWLKTADYPDFLKASVLGPNGEAQLKNPARDGEEKLN